MWGIIKARDSMICVLSTLVDPVLSETKPPMPIENG